MTTGAVAAGAAGYAIRPSTPADPDAPAVAEPAPRHPVPAPIRPARRRRGRTGTRVAAGVAAGHPVTAEVGLRMLAAGGSAADAAVAAMLASCAAESVLAGLGGGGFATYFDAASRTVTALDFFCAVPGLDGDREPGEPVRIDIRFGDVEMDYRIGGASVAVPGVPAGAAEVHRRWGRLSWQHIVQPAVVLARSGVVLPTAQAVTLNTVHRALTPGDGAAIYAPGGRLLSGGDLLFHPGLDVALTALAGGGAGEFYTGPIGALMVEIVRAGGGALGPADLAAYRVREVPVRTARFAGRSVYARDDLNGTIRTLAALPDRLGTLSRPHRAVALADAMRANGLPRLGDTTNISVVDDAGNACVITVTMGLGSGIWLPGLGVHLNSMLGEGELLTGPAEPGARMNSMMCPMVVLADGASGTGADAAAPVGDGGACGASVDGRSGAAAPAGDGGASGVLEMAAGSAGASRIRTALLHTMVNTMVDGMPLREAIAAPRFHVAGNMVHAEAGYPADELDALAEHGYKVTVWPGLDHFFGAASAVGVSGAAGDPRRGGSGILLR